MPRPKKLLHDLLGEAQDGEGILRLGRQLSRKLQRGSAVLAFLVHGSLRGRIMAAASARLISRSANAFQLRPYGGCWHSRSTMWRAMISLAV